MKHYILISNTKEYLINKKLLDNISFRIEKFTDSKITFKELVHEMIISDFNNQKNQ